MHQELATTDPNLNPPDVDIKDEPAVVPNVDDTQPSNESDSNEQLSNATRDLAVKVIQRAWRLHVRQQWETTHPKEGLVKRRGELFEWCLKTSEQITFPSAKHRYIFLGSLPHLLLCVEELNAYASSEKTSAKKEFRDKGAGSSDASSRLNEVT